MIENTHGHRLPLSELLEGIVAIEPDRDVPIGGIALDSREVEPGDVFFAYPGTARHGRDYVYQAIDNGAVAVIYEPGVDAFPELGVACYPLSNLQRRVGVIADRFYGHPSRYLRVVGVTGTNGKTTCTHILMQALEYLGERCGFIGTLGIGFKEELCPGRHTTPDPIRLHRSLRRFLDLGASYVCMEVSSHAMDQGRAEGVAFDVALFTNLSHDHLDYHQDMAAYGGSKAQLFDCVSLEIAVLNDDDAFSAVLRERTKARTVIGYGMKSGDVFAESITPGDNGLDLVVNSRGLRFSVSSSLLGRVNALNLLAATTVLLAQGWDGGDVASAMERLRPVPGRMELFRALERLPAVVVDYAHTPDALANALRSIREHCHRRLWVVFGCGGDRDRGKRPLMGQVAEQLADVVVLTDDNPRSERPQAIVSEIVAGMDSSPTVIHDRAEAIQWAIRHAGAEDWVVVAGKGHETTQQLNDREIPLSDRDIVTQTLGMAA